MTTITSNQVTVTVTQPPVSAVKLSASPTSITGSGTVTFTATVTGTAGGTSIPLSGISVSFYNNNGSNLQGTATTNSSGVATFSYTYNNVATGYDQWVAVASGVYSNTVQITLNAAGTYSAELTINGQANSVTLIEDTNYTAAVTVTNSVTGPVSGATVTLKDTTTGATQTATTNSSGVATFTVNFPTTGTYVFVATVTLP